MMGTSSNFPGPLSTKRRRMRSGGLATATGGLVPNGGGNVTATVTTMASEQDEALETLMTTAQIEASIMNDEENISEQKTTQTSKCKGATTIPIFLKKTYKMVDTCDPTIASWTDDGDMFVVKDPDLFATNVIPQYFDHNKFSSFARQLNFYGFRKMQSKPIRNSDFDVSTSKYVTFFNENFKKGRCDLLKKIQRSTRGGGTSTPMDQSREILLLRDQVSNLEQQVSEIMEQTEERVRRLELEMLSRIEQVAMSLQQKQHQQQQSNLFQLEPNTSIGSVMSRSSTQQQQQSMSMPAPLPQQSTYPTLSTGTTTQQQLQQNAILGSTWDAYNANLRQSSISSGANSVANIVGNQINFLNMQQQQQQQQQAQVAPPTLPPHPKQKQLPGGIIPSNRAQLEAPDRMNSLRGLSTMSRGISALTRGASVESSASAVLLRNSWEDKFFSMLMLEANDQNTIPESNIAPNPINLGPATVSEETVIDMNQLNNNAAQLSQLTTQSSAMEADERNNNDAADDDQLSDVSSGDLP